jgi:hypothetical protein
MLTKEQLQKLIGIEIFVNNNSFKFTIFSVEDELMKVRWDNSAIDSDMYILNFNKNMLPKIFMYASDETDDLISVKDFIEIID